MAKVEGILTKVKGLVGEAVFRTVNNQTVVYQRPDIKDARTKRSVTIRVRMANIAAFYSATEKALLRAFEDVTTKTNSYNMFFSHNIRECDVHVYLSKDDVACGTAIAAPYIAGEGTLTPIVGTYSNGMMVSDVKLNGFVINADTTVGQFTNAIRNANLGRFHEGDQITYLALKQLTRNGHPYLKRIVSYVYLDGESTEKLWSKDYACKAFQSQNDYLVAAMSFEGSAAWLLTHENSDNTFKSSETRFCCYNTILESYTTTKAFERAAASYGGYNDILLSPGTDHEIDNEEEGSTPTTTVTITAKVASGQDAMGTVQAGSSAAGATSSVTVAKNTSVQLKAVANTGYHFKQWNDGSTQATISVVADATATYTATFEADTPTGNVTVTLTSEDVAKGKVQINGGEQGATATATVTSGSSVTIKAISVAGYDFLKWSDNNQNYERTLTPTENVSLTAYFEEE